MDRHVVRVIAAATFFFTVAVGAILSILPVYMVEVLGATALVVGVVEGLGSAVEAVTLVFSGALSDRLGRRKPLAVAGYGLYLLIKPVFILAGQLWIVAAARVADRFSIAVFAAPQQALIGDVSAAGGRGAAFGLRAAADGLGAMTGPVLATVALGALGLGYEAVFWIALAAAA
ncbi:MAG: MFS transporter, partial [Rhodospirillales bacterium]